MKNTVPPLWENPEIQEINRLPARSPLLPFASAEDALLYALSGPEYRRPEDNPFYFPLDGEWQFRLLPNPGGDIPPDSGGDWSAIKVPGTWTRQGFDKPHYTNIQMPFQAAPPRVPEENPTGLYRRTFSLPPRWKDRRVVLHIGSAESVALVYLNGVFAGMGKDSRLPSEFDITDFLSAGENTLCVKVVRYSDASYVEDQDEWWLGGIHRTVFLYSTEDCFIQDIKAAPGSFASRDGKTAGKIDLAVTIGGNLPEGRSVGNDALPLHDASLLNGPAPGRGGEGGVSADRSPFTVKYGLYAFSLPESAEDAAEKARVLAGEGACVSGEIELFCDYRINGNTARAELRLEDPMLWSHEEANLYLLLVDLFRNGRRVESTAFLTAFRNLEITGRELLINGKAVLIKGVNRHEHDEKTGKTLSTEAMLRDIRLLKEHNFNAVRTSHYPNDERWYELCDRYGIYLVDEADIESHCFYDQLCDDGLWLNAFTSRIRRMAVRDKNHPSIIIWSLGNESGWGSNLEAGAAWLRRYDPSRPLNYEGAIRPDIPGQRTPTLDSLCQGKTVSDIIGPMYPALELITNFVKYREDPRPLIMIEYSHAMGNSNGGLADYWKAIESHHGLQGGFIWEWKDHGFEAFTDDGRKYWKYGGDFGDEPSDFDFCCDGLLFPDQSLKPAMEECKQLFSPVRLVPVPERPFAFILENRYDFSALDNLELRWELREDIPGEKEEIIRKGVLPLPDLNAGEKREIALIDEALSLSARKGTLYIHAEFALRRAVPLLRAGHIVARSERLLREALPQKADRVLPSGGAYSSGGAPSTASPRLSPWGEERLLEFARLFRPSLFRVPTQNDGLKTGIPLRGDPSASFYYKGKAMYHWLDLDLLHLGLADEKTESCLYEGRGAKKYSASLLAGEHAAEKNRGRVLGTYTAITAFGDGGSGGDPSLVLDVVFCLDPSLPELPKVGISARLPAKYAGISWFGRGPCESYPDRLAAALLGRYTHRVDEMEVPYVMPQESGNRSGVRNFSLLAENERITVIAENPVNLSVSRYTPENLWEARHTWELRDLLRGGGKDNAGGYYFLNIDIAQRGVGTATCGPDTREEYRIRPGVFAMKLLVRGAVSRG